MSYHWHDFVGNAGVIMILYAYWQIQREKWSPKNWSYSAVNGLGAGLILISLMVSFNLSAFIIEICWLFISIYGLFRVSSKS